MGNGEGQGTDLRQQILLTNPSVVRTPFPLPTTTKFSPSIRGRHSAAGFGCSARANPPAFSSPPLPAAAAADQPFSPPSHGNRILSSPSQIPSSLRYSWPRQSSSSLLKKPHILRKIVFFYCLCSWSPLPATALLRGEEGKKEDVQEGYEVIFTQIRK
ncbi:hypothetical protein COCNU_03G015190 [Cocos nucifera]|uniref:Uncharacterized protein n=1 Tax=Cocos nucifera TaxID=13894 RepID=A0A8K0I3X9_COCNU|nr:hypothetical protein COCNU_03G015190 [Cocos nucifera]